ncbi:hypothetical protein NY2A_b473L [Paramecium bursaria Chlorella virus NY2A]|uniref:Uncharacterized protein b473L n=1 Tax=Paramecium bursaria Chlorella virus NY2A TaxID=46021 RepID=A7IWZ8_PBCVN|nr:hypothetical protein NY2A_b473L [Paramecium bursaria Chlorella virus NY2A]ABT14872.1 hypothetical protein NY2A_b473L [Paramecium bursaria Chlorella virus NY2A]
MDSTVLSSSSFVSRYAVTRNIIGSLGAVSTGFPLKIMYTRCISTHAIYHREDAAPSTRIGANAYQYS